MGGITTFTKTKETSLTAAAVRIALLAAILAFLLFLSLYNLTTYPAIWFDEGSYLHVPKTLVRFGVYADYSSEGFRYYGPIVGMGPTVMLPIAGMFSLFGTGLFQARLVSVAYLLAAIYAFYHLGRRYGGPRLGLAAAALLAAAHGVSLLDYGREALGEVPGLFFLVAGLLAWFADWNHPTWRRLALAGLLFGLSAVTKAQYLLVILPAIGLSWLANLIYYRLAAQRVFAIPALVAGAVFGSWQAYMVLYLGPSTAADNFVLLRQTAAGAAFNLSPALMLQNIQSLLDFKATMGLLLPSLVYGVFLALHKHKDAQQMGVLLALAASNLVWYALASIGWIRYAFPGLALSSLFAARFIFDLTGGLRLNWRVLRPGSWKIRMPWKEAGQAALLGWLALSILLPLGVTVQHIISPPPDDAGAMASFMNARLPLAAVVETWEPEMGFLTNHNYHYPPNSLLNQAVSYMWLHGESLTGVYTYLQDNNPPYLLLGQFSSWLYFYPDDYISARYTLIKKIGAYRLYELRP